MLRSVGNFQTKKMKEKEKWKKEARKQEREMVRDIEG